MVSIGSIWLATASPMAFLSRLRPVALSGRPVTGSVQSRLELLQQRGGAVARRVAAVAPQKLLEGRDRRAIIVEMRVKQPGLAPESSAIGGEPHHDPDDCQRHVEPPAL